MGKANRIPYSPLLNGYWAAFIPEVLAMAHLERWMEKFVKSWKMLVLPSLAQRSRPVNRQPLTSRLAAQRYRSISEDDEMGEQH